jgi:hypothetical protein
MELSPSWEAAHCAAFGNIITASKTNFLILGTAGSIQLNSASSLILWLLQELSQPGKAC